MFTVKVNNKENKMPLKLKKIFEKEYIKKGKTKAEADRIFYSYENKFKKSKLIKHKKGGK
jgi:hypothetical protein